MVARRPPTSRGARARSRQGAPAARAPARVEVRPPPGPPLRATLPRCAAIAVPPPRIDDPPSASARLDGLREELEAATEVMALCDRAGRDDEGTPLGPLAVYVIALRRDDAGTWRAMAWRDLTSERF